MLKVCMMDIELEGYDTIVPNAAYAKVPMGSSVAYVLSIEQFRTATMDEFKSTVRNTWDSVKDNSRITPNSASNDLERLFTYFQDDDTFDMLTGVNFIQYCLKRDMLTEPVYCKVGFLYGSVSTERSASNQSPYSRLYEQKTSMTRSLQHIDEIIGETANAFAFSLLVQDGRLPDFDTVTSTIRKRYETSDLAGSERYSLNHMNRLLRVVYNGLYGKIDLVAERNRHELVSEAACQAITLFMESIGLENPLNDIEENDGGNVPLTVN